MSVCSSLLQPYRPCRIQCNFYTFADHAEAETTAGFEAARRRLYSADGVPGFLTAAADELRTRHPGVPFLDHAWGQARCLVLASVAL